MRAKVAKLLRRQASLMGQDYRRIKREWKRLPRWDRHPAKLEMLAHQVSKAALYR